MPTPLLIIETSGRVLRVRVEYEPSQHGAAFDYVRRVLPVISELDRRLRADQAAGAAPTNGGDQTRDS